MTKSIISWSKSPQINVKLCPAIPHEHHQIGLIEIWNQILEASIIKQLYGKTHISAKYWAMAYLDIIEKTNILPSIHQPQCTPYQQWTGTTVDFIKYPMVPFGTIVMAHKPVHLQGKLEDHAIPTYAVGTSINHQEGLILFNPDTKLPIIRRSYKLMGTNIPVPVSTTLHCNFEPTDEPPVILPPSEPHFDPPPPPADSHITSFDYLLNTTHIDPDDNYTYRTCRTEIVDYSDGNGPIIVAYRKRLTPDGKRTIRTKDDDQPYQIQDIVNMTASHTIKTSFASLTPTPPTMYNRYLLEAPSAYTTYLGAKASKSSFVLAPGSAPRNMTDLYNLSDLDPDKAGYLAAKDAELASLNKMLTFHAVDQQAIEWKNIGRSRLIFTKKYNSDGSFDKYKCRLVFRGDRWKDFYNNKTYAGTVMSDSV
jgi:hypothetical protein